MTQTDGERKQETMGRRLASQRALLGLSQTEAAEKAGMTQAYLSMVENDKAASPALNTIAKLAEVYGVTLDYVVNGEAA